MPSGAVDVMGTGSLVAFVLAGSVEVSCIGFANKWWSKTSRSHICPAQKKECGASMLFMLVMLVAWVLGWIFSSIPWYVAIVAVIFSIASQFFLARMLRAGYPVPRASGGCGQAADAPRSRWLRVPLVLNVLAWITPVALVDPRFSAYALLIIGSYQSFAATWAVDLYQTVMERFPDNTEGRQRDLGFAGAYALIVALVASYLLLLGSIYSVNYHEGFKWVWALLIASLIAMLGRVLPRKGFLRAAPSIVATALLGVASCLIIIAVGLTWRDIMLVCLLALMVAAPLVESFIWNAFRMRLQRPTWSSVGCSALPALCFAVVLGAIIMGHVRGAIGLGNLAIWITLALVTYFAILASQHEAAHLEPVGTPISKTVPHYTPNSVWFNLSHDFLLSVAVFIAAPLFLSILGLFLDLTFIVSVALVIAVFAVGNLWAGAPPDSRTSTKGDVENWYPVRLVESRLETEGDSQHAFSEWVDRLKRAYRARGRSQLAFLGSTGFMSWIVVCVARYLLSK